ncbi:CDP-diacylglycerol--glycerol-3-phosphate 3-phosphatidyltransferase [Rhodospirillum rubrum]|uniref:CDP-diacylglycerol--glycerol-3-phosphate 3-phosphatidyltransferase n=3 Tax=Rhodospirillum rubrum TaxID=1085 RepID=Q2RS74_RHORT|nr:CDP-diacylglycerol--glycerol-3-phosphate 3-phosphatidyltransferase [Rhodospirillum rubrum]ABC23021.1 CDP-diacylglycerol--glycerol-3-phosphate 3-phosphatidyltransferase [Rhodospirillum rubrum ATCC 11170]AEO48750.1 CDP-diacylglycerol--glycerol-3-phosphate 3-phosphatidyltransferase [Rhodospirillum rubrum F11]MBK1678510.1 CDP-diacylglycerol--glycerol-3-phosphate 3-phosphatidyltransferase [Rhodospirillum rubrum]MBK5954644.1 CDP-diacylglycerol--glycerol-3-phosphate 3-phosphatidyltransferase [Rhodo
MLTLPNILTLLRILIIPLVVVLFYVDGEGYRWANCALFAVAAITDFFDGWLARRSNQVSRLGRFLDPIADKLLVAAVLMLLVGFGRMSPWSYPAAVVILMREILVSGLREFLAEIRVGMPVTKLAKWKTTVQLIALPVLIVGDTPLIPLPITLIGEGLLWVAAVMTIITGYDYLRVGLRHMGPEHDAPPSQAHNTPR